MPSEASKHWGDDSFDSDTSATNRNRRVSTGDRILDADDCLNPDPKAAHNGLIHSEQYGTVDAGPGRSSLSMNPQIDVGYKSRRVMNEQYDAVDQMPGQKTRIVKGHGHAGLGDHGVHSEQFPTVKGRLA